MRESNILFKKFCDVYEDLYKQISLNNDYVLNLSKIDSIMLNNFIIKISKITNVNSINIDYVCEYCEFQYNYWHQLKTQHKIQMSWIFGDKAFKRWIEYKDKIKQKKFFKYKTKLKVDINFSIKNKIVKNINFDEIRKGFLIIKEHEEIEKRRFFNSDKGLIWCTNETTLYNHKSSLCLTCKNKEDCKVILKDVFPLISKVRGYND